VKEIRSLRQKKMAMEEGKEDEWGKENVEEDKLGVKK